MFKPSQPMMARLRLTTKQVNGGYYKGNRTGSMGYFASNGSSYVIDWKKVRTYVVPEHLDQFKLTPFVTKAMAPTRSRYTNEVQKPDGVAKVDRAFNGRDYVDMWSSDNGQEVLEQERLEEEAKAPAPAPAPEAEAEPAQAPAQKRKKTSRQ